MCVLSPNRSAAVAETPEPQITAWGLSLAHRLALWWLPRAARIVFHFHETTSRSLGVRGLSKTQIKVKDQVINEQVRGAFFVSCLGFESLKRLPSFAA